MIIIGFVLLVSYYISAAPVESNNNDIASIPNMYGSKKRSTARGKKAKAYNLHSTLMF